MEILKFYTDIRGEGVTIDPQQLVPSMGIEQKASPKAVVVLEEQGSSSELSPLLFGQK